jgi:tRNA threonylcarbamoyladenosine biosynthesis protein TsaB
VSTRILALDTTSVFGSLALLEDETLLEEMLLHSQEGFSHLLFGYLRELLQRQGWDIHDVDCLAATSGPGSFTGVRVGLAAAKGLAEAVGRPVVAVSNLQAVASFGAACLRACFLDARRGEVYGAVYDSSLESVQPERVMAFSAWLDQLPPAELELITTDPAPFQEALRTTRYAALSITRAPRALAAAVGRIAARRFRQGLAVDPAAVDANYVRRSDAELHWKGIH